MAAVQNLTITGHIQKVDLEGGFWGIVDNDDNKFVPLNPLGSSYQVDGLSVQVNARPVTVLGISMWGQHIEVLSIQKVS